VGTIALADQEQSAVVEMLLDRGDHHPQVR
jgi:hypothetical protein